MLSPLSLQNLTRRFRVRRPVSSQTHARPSRVIGDIACGLPRDVVAACSVERSGLRPLGGSQLYPESLGPSRQPGHQFLDRKQMSLETQKELEAVLFEQHGACPPGSDLAGLTILVKTGGKRKYQRNTRKLYRSEHSINIRASTSNWARRCALLRGFPGWVTGR